MEIKLIQNDEFTDLCDLVTQMYKSIDENINDFQAINTLVHFINTMPDFLAIGLYDDDVLIGCVTGHALNERIYFYSGIYVLGNNSKAVKLLIDESFKLIQDRGYLGWEVDATNDNICSIMEKYNASKKYTRYYKEFEND